MAIPEATNLDLAVLDREVQATVATLRQDFRTVADAAESLLGGNAQDAADAMSEAAYAEGMVSAVLAVQALASFDLTRPLLTPAMLGLIFD